MKTRVTGFLATAAVMFAVGTGAHAQAEDAPQGRTVGYVLTTFSWALHTTEKKTECPEGMNDGPRAQYKQLFPEDGTKRNVVDTVLRREADVWFPSAEPEALKFKELVSRIGLGLNLDGKNDPDDFESKDGEKGIDNQFYRAFGCVADVRPGGSIYTLQNDYMRKYNYARTLIELTDVDSLTNDDDVTVTTYRGLDSILTDATGASFLQLGTQRVDEKWGKKFVQRMRGKIVDGTLVTEPADVTLPYTFNYYPRQHYTVRGAVFKLDLTSERARGLFAGYLDIRSWYRATNGALSTYTQSFGDQSSPSLYRAMHRYADAYPDPATGRNTAISTAQEVMFTRVYIRHGNPAAAQTVARADQEK